MTPSATLFYGVEADVVSANEGEAWSAFVTHMLAERTEYKAHAIALYREVAEHRYVEVTIMPTDGVRITLHISTEVEPDGFRSNGTRAASSSYAPGSARPVGTRRRIPNYERELAASATPWLVPQRVWTREQITDWRNGELVQGKVRIARCYDPRPGLECWCYRLLRYDSGTETWEWASPGRKRVPFFDRLSAAKSALISGERRDWWTT